MPRLVCISDTHGFHDFDVPDGDVLVHAGDLTKRGGMGETRAAAEWLRSVSEKELARVLHEYGEERFSRRIARRIVEERRRRPILTTGQLTEVILATLPS